MGSGYFGVRKAIKSSCLALIAGFLTFSGYIHVETASSFDLSQLDLSQYQDYPVLEIPKISLETPVESISLEGRSLTAPDYIAGSYSRNLNKTLLFGHSSTVFQDLDVLSVTDTLTYNGITYQITDIETIQKSDVSMSQILKTEDQDTIILMTCAGDSLPNQDATHRLIITAEPIEAVASSNGII